MNRAQKVPFFDFRPGAAPLLAELEAAVRRVLDSGRVILGPEVEAFEREFASWVGAAGAVGVASGTDALILALRACGVGPGHEVITVANAGVPTVAAIRAAGATPRFVDVDPRTLQLDPVRLPERIGEATRAVVPVHLYGRPAPLGPLLELTRRHGIAVIEDCAQGHGTRIGGRHVGTFGRVGCFSFYPTKNLGAFGDAGLCVSDDPALLERLRMLRMYGFDDARHARIEGLNSRLDELQAALLRVKLRVLERALEERRRLAELYARELDGTTILEAPCAPDEVHGRHLLVVRVPDRARVIASLAAEGVGCGVHYPEPVHRMEAYRGLPDAGLVLEATERACREVLSLPLYPGLGEEAVRRVARAVRAAL